MICQSSLFSVRHHSLFSDPSPVIVAFLVTRQSSLFSDPPPVIIAFLVTHQNIFLIFHVWSTCRQLKFLFYDKSQILF
jgi:hypothetical protein